MDLLAPGSDPAWNSTETLPPVGGVGVTGPSSFYSPTSWFGLQIWDISFELGLNGQSGNTDTLSFKTGIDIKHETERKLHKYDISYARTRTEGVTTQSVFIFDSRGELKFGDSPFSFFIAQNIVADRQRDFDIRLAVNAGLSYKLFNTEVTQLSTRFGGGFSREIGGIDDNYVGEAVFGMDYERQYTSRQKFTGSVDYYPEWDFSEYRMITKGAWVFLLDAESDLSLKIEATNRYDSTPNGAKANDINYSLLLLWKL